MIAPFFGKIRATVLRNGKAVEHRIVNNFLTEDGEALIANRLSTASSGAFSDMAIGTGTGQERTDTTLATELTRVALDSLTQGTAGDDNDVVMVATFPSGTSGTITEGAVFNAASGGNMLNYFNFSPPIVKGTSDSIVLTVTMTCGYS